MVFWYFIEMSSFSTQSDSYSMQLINCCCCNCNNSNSKAGAELLIMSVLECQKVNLIKLVNYIPNKLSSIRTDITAYCCNGSDKIFCDTLGNVHVYFKNWDGFSFQVNNGPVSLCSITRDGTFVTLIQNNNNYEITLRVYNVQKLSKKNGTPCQASARLKAFSKATVLKVEHNENLMAIAIGLEKGEILLHHAAIYRDLSSNFRTISTGMRAVTGIEYDIMNKTGGSFYMFVSTTDNIFRFLIGDNNSNYETKFNLDALKGSQPDTHCCAMYYSKHPEAAYFALGRYDAIYCFTHDGRGPCYALEGQKKFLTWVKNYMFVVIKKQATWDITLSTVIVFDIKNKIIVFNQTLETEVECIFEQNDACIIVTKKSKQMFVFQELDIQDQIHQLVNANMYDIALRIVEDAQDNNVTNFGYINLKYGDYLFQKKKILEAVNRYGKTIGVVKPFDVIENLLDSRNNKFLIQYLTSLVHSDYVSDDHRNLLQKCNERLDLPKKIKKQCDVQISEMSSLSSGSQETETIFNNGDINFVELVYSLDDNSFNVFFMEFIKKCLSENSEDLSRDLKTFIESNISKNSDKKQNTKIASDDLKYDIKIYTCLLEHILRLWKANLASQEDTLKLLNYCRNYIHIEHALILCWSYSFTSGIHEILKSDLKSGMSINENISMHKCMQHFNKEGMHLLKKPENNVPLLSTLLLKSPQYLLQTLDNISNNKNTSVSYIRSFFSDGHLRNIIPITSQLKEIQALTNKVKTLTDLLLNFKKNPIEFRNSVCDICRQDLKLPSTFFLCQHSFHKDCSSYYKRGVCMVCSTHLERPPLPNRSSIILSKPEEENLDISTPLLKRLFTFPMESWTLNAMGVKEENSNASLSNSSSWKARVNTEISETEKDKIKVSKNPFDDENTNPFDE